MLHPHTTLRYVDEEIGFGVFATRPIPAGTITWALDPLDRIITADRVAEYPSSLQDSLERYGFLNGRGDYILCWDFGRFVNHSCQPNVLAPGLEVEIAIRDIAEGEQMLGDYGAYNIERDLHCLCGAPSCRGVIRRSDFDLMADAWDDLLRAAVTRVGLVTQPLWDHVQDPTVLIAAASEPRALPSCAAHRMAAASP